jgi:hypothetical protein
MAIITDTRNMSVMGALTTDLGQSLIIEQYPGNKYLAASYPGVRYTQEGYICIRSVSFGEGKDQHSPELNSEIWLTKREWEKLLEQVIKSE